MYPENEIQWTTGDAEGGISGLGGQPAIVAISVEDVGDIFQVQESETSDIINIDTLSNIEMPGVFVFRVDSDFLQPGVG